MGRIPVEQGIERTWRNLAAEKARQSAKREAASIACGTATRRLDAAVQAASARLRKPVPYGDPLLLDALDLVERIILPDGQEVWRWSGMTNNKNLPVLRVHTREISVRGYLARAFGAVPRDWQGILYPKVTGPHDRMDVYPWNFTPRNFTGKPPGNPGRFGTATGARAS